MANRRYIYNNKCYSLGGFSNICNFKDSKIFINAICQKYKGGKQ